MKFFLKRLHNKKGFTLIELIVVIAILAILALIAVPRFAGFTDKADDAADNQYGSLMGNAIVVLMAEGEITAGGSITIATDGSFVNAGGLTGGTNLADDDARITALVAPKALAGSGTITVAVTIGGVVTVTLN